MLIALYLVAIALANLSVSYFGPSSAIVNAFLFIGLDLTTRDRLHQQWHGKHLWLKMFALVASGSILSYILNANAGPIALASFVSFLVSGLVDTLVYHLLRDRKDLIRVNGSNISSALADSLIFPTLAFGQFLPLIVLGQWLAKITGGFIWSLILRKKGE